MSVPDRFPPRHALKTLAALAALWWVAVTWGVPLLIRAVHDGRIPLLAALEPGRVNAPVDAYLARWVPLARASVVVVLTGALMLAAAVLLVRRGRRRRAGVAPSCPPASTGDLLLIAAWCGMLTGMGEAWYLVMRAFYRHQVVPGFLNVSQHAVWMSPLADTAVLLATGAVLTMVHRAWPRKVEQRVVVAGLAWLGVFGVIMTTDRLHWLATAMLATGIAVQVHGAIEPGAGEVVRAARRSMGWLVAAVACAGALVPVAEWQRERRQLAAAGVPAAGAPNVIFIVMDTERAASTSLHGAARPTTPFLERLAPEGAFFSLAVAPASWTLPSHAAMFTGRDTRDLAVDWHTPLGTTWPTLAEAMTAGGYVTAGFVANQYFGSDLFGLARGFGRWEDQPIRPGTIVSHSWLARTVVLAVRRRLGNHQELGRKTADDINASFLSWLGRPRSRPFFAFLNYLDPHLPYLPPEPWNTRFASPQPLYWIGEDRPWSSYSAAEVEGLRAAYDGSIAYLDDRLGQLVAALRQRGLLENTVLVITSDHGEALGENGQLDHGTDLNLSRVHVPLVVVAPGRIPPGTRIDAPVELRHLAATVLDLASVDRDGVAGHSLAVLWAAGRAAGDGAALSEDGEYASLVTGQFQYLRKTDGGERLFDHRRDYFEGRNLVQDPNARALLDSLRRALKARREAPSPGR